MRAPFFQRIVEALLLRRSLYEYAASEPESWREAMAVVCIVALVEGFAISSHLAKEGALFGALGLLFVLANNLACWVVIGAFAHAVGRLVTGGSDFKRVLRCFGFGSAPVALRAFASADPSDPRVAPAVELLVGLWLLATSVVAFRAALATTDGRAALAAFLLRAIVVVAQQWTGVQFL